MASRQDTFASRTVASGWGTASDGNVWTTNAGDSQSVSSNEGRITTSSASTFNSLGAALSADTNTAVRWSVSDVSNTSGVLARFQSTSQYYLARYDGAGNIAFFKNVGGTKTTVASVAFTVTGGSFYWTRFVITGSTIQVRVWADGSNEPSTWLINTTDTSITAAGEVGLYGFSNFSPGNTYDSFNAQDVSSGTPIHLSATLPTQDGLSGALGTGLHFSALLATTSSLAASLHIPRGLAGGVVGSASSFSGHLSSGSPGTGIGDLVASSGSISWTGTSGSPGTEYRDTYKDSTGYGWAVGSVPTYGGMPIGPVYAEEANTADQEASLSTTQPGGHIHWLDQTDLNGWGGSEDPQFTRTELAPVGTLFRRYFQTVATANDVDGMLWTAWACVYPGDPGLIAYRFDMHNPGASAVTFSASDGLEIALIGSLEQNDAIWNPANGGYGQLAGSDTVGWPSALTNIEPDYVYILPASTTTLGQATVKKTSLPVLGWSNLQVQYLQNTSRLKFKVQSDGMTIAAGGTQTVYLLQVLKRNLTAAITRAIAADYLYPGTPTTATGSFTSFSYDERAYVFAAAGNALSATLDFSPTHVTVRYKPVYKITGWTASQPAVSWGGTTLVAGTDYRYTVDSTNHVLYLQLYCDVVASGAGAGQRNNAALTVQNAVIALAGTLPSGSGLHLAGATPLVIARSLAVASSSFAGLAASLPILRHLAASLPAADTLSGTLTHRPEFAATLPSTLAFSAPALTISRPLTSTLAATATLVPTLPLARPLHAQIGSGAALTGTLSTSAPFAASLASGSGMQAMLRVGRPLASTLPAGDALSATIQTTGGMHGALTASEGLSGTLLRATPLHSAVSFASGMAGTLSVAKLQGSVSSQSSLQVSLLTVKRPLTAGLSTTASVGGSPLHSTRRLAGGAGLAVSLSGSLSLVSALPSVTLSSVASLAGTLSLSRSLQGSMVGQGSLSGRLTVTLLHASMGANASLSASALLVSHRLATGLSTQSGMQATLTLGHPAIPLAAGLPSGTGLAFPHLTIHRTLQVAAPVQHTLAASLPLTRSLSASLTAGDGLHGVCTRTVALSQAIPTADTASAALGVSRHLSATLSSLVFLSAILKLTSSLPPQVLMLLLSESTNGLALTLSDLDGV